MLLSEKFDIKKERTSRVGYILDYDASPLTKEELLYAHVALTTDDIHQLVELGYREAVQICKDLLHMPVPQPPLILAPLSGVTSKAKSAPNRTMAVVDDKDSDADIEEEDDDDNSEAQTEQDGDADADTSAKA